MRYSDVFGSCHPAVNFLYFVLVIAFSMCLTHPVCLLLSVCGAVIYHAVLLGPRSLRKSAVWMVPMAVLAAVINPAFTHQGVTILAYLPSGNPLTLESMLYGLASAALPFFTTGIAVAHGRGIILCTAEKSGVPLYEYTPMQVKQAVVGYGLAEKRQVMDMVKRLLKLKAVPRPDDAADALAIAICHARSATSLLSRVGGNDVKQTI